MTSCACMRPPSDVADDDGVPADVTAAAAARVFTNVGDDPNDASARMSSSA